MDTQPHTDQQYTPREPASPIELAAALRSVGEETRSSAWNRSFMAVAKAVESGTPLERAVETVTPPLPTGTAPLLLAAAGVGQTGAILAGLGDHNRRRVARRDELISIFAYPVLLMLLAAVVGILVFLYLRPEITSMCLSGTHAIIDDFGLRPGVSMSSKSMLIDAQWLQDRQPWPVVIGFGGLLALCSLSAISWKVAPALFDRLVGWIPILGELFRRAAQQEWCRLASLLVALGRPLDEATDAATAMLPPGDVADAMKAVGPQLRGGDSLTRSMTEQATFPATVTAIVAWGETHNATAEALSAAGDLLGDQVRARMEMIKNITGPLIVVLVAALATSFLVAVLEPLIMMASLIESLT
jgi:type II secretory pathway component PulF